MKIYYTIVFLFWGLCVSFAQENTFDYPDLKNPKILEIQRIQDMQDPDYTRLKNQYDAIFNGENLEDKVHLFIFDLSNPKGSFADYRFEYSDQVQSILSGIDDLPQSDFKSFAAGLLYKRLADHTYQNPKEETDYLNKSFHTLLNLASRGDERSIIPLAKAASELYVLGFKDDHLSEKLILGLYSDYMSMVNDNSGLINYLIRGLYSENAFQVPLSDAEEKEKHKYKEIVSKIIKRYLIDFPDDNQYLIYQLWTNHLTNHSFTSIEIKYNPEIGKSISSLIDSFKDDETIDYNKIKSVDFIFQYFLEENTDLDLQDYIQLFSTKKEAFEVLITCLNEVSRSELIPFDLLTQKPKWVQVFQNEIEQDFNTVFPILVRYSDEYELVLNNKKLEISTIKKSVENFDKIKSFLFNDKVTGGYMLLRLYEYGKFMSAVIEQEAFKNNSDLKWEQARMLLDFEYIYLLTKTIHSPTILGISSVFDNWTSTEIEKHKKDIEEKLFDYLESYEEVSELTMEGEIVKDELKKIAVKFNLI